MTVSTGTGTDGTLEAALAALVEEFAGVFAADTVQECLVESYGQLLPARVTGYLPLLAHRFARERLRAASRVASRDAPSETDAARRPPLVLFVCGANSGRSQLAAALLAHEASGRVEVASAGTAPAGQVQPEVTQVLVELGIDTSELFPKPLTPQVQAAADVVVTMGCAEHVDLGAEPRRYLDWDVADPAGMDVSGVREVRDEISQRVHTLLVELAATSRT